MHVRRSFVVCALVFALAAVFVDRCRVRHGPAPQLRGLKVGSRNYTIKADQIRCSTAKADAKAYLVSRKVPRGFSCRNFTAAR